MPLADISHVKRYQILHMSGRIARNLKLHCSSDTILTFWVPGDGGACTVFLGVSREAWRTVAAGLVVHHTALGGGCTRPRTGVDTLLVDAGEAPLAVSVQHTLRATP